MNVNPELLIAGTAAFGYFVGQGGEQLGLNNIKANREAAIVTGKGAGPTYNKYGWRRAVAPLALVLGISGVALGYGLEGVQISEGQAPDIQLVVDHDALTSVDGVAPVVSDIAVGFEQQTQGEDSTHLFSAHNSTFDLVTPKELLRDNPYGQNTVDQAVTATLTSGFTAAPSAQTNLLKKTSEKSGAEVVEIDSSDDLPNVNVLQSDAENAGGIPIYIVNANDSKSSPAVRTDLQQLATETGGQYWSADAANYKSVEGQMESVITPHNKLKNKANSGVLVGSLVVSGALMGTAAWMYTRRRNETAA